MTTHASQQDHEERIKTLETRVDSILGEYSKILKQLRKIKQCHEKMKTELETLRAFTPSESL